MLKFSQCLGIKYTLATPGYPCIIKGHRHSDDLFAHVQYDLHAPNIIISITNLDFDDLTVAALARSANNSMENHAYSYHKHELVKLSAVYQFGRLSLNPYT